jgi:hypothetical protein
MMSQPHEHSVRRILLPSGRSIEVVRFEDLSDVPERPGLHVCQSCSSDLVQPNDWVPAADDGWEMTLHCPNCGWSTHGVYDDAEVTQLEEQLEEGVDAILRDLQRLASANMADEVERFARALAADVILPEDF